MDHRPSWEANRFWTSQEIPRISWNPNLHYRITRARHLYLSWARPIQVKLPRSTSSKFLLSLSSHLRLGLPSGLFPQVSPPKPSMHLFCHHTCTMPRQSLSSWFELPSNIWWGVQIIKLLIMQSSPLTFYLVSLRTKYLPQYHFLEHP
jgi:hypothetical protein